MAGRLRAGRTHCVTTGRTWQSAVANRIPMLVESCPMGRRAMSQQHRLRVTSMNRSYRDGWAEIFGDRDDTLRSTSEKEEFLYVEPPVITAEEIEWANTRALSIRQPWAELIMLGEKDTEYRSRATNVRGRIAIYASLSNENLEDAELFGLSLDRLPRGVLIGTVELFDCDEGDWRLREPKRLATPLKPTAHPQPVWFYPFGRE